MGTEEATDQGSNDPENAGEDDSSSLPARHDELRQCTAIKPKTIHDRIPMATALPSLLRADCVFLAEWGRSQYAELIPSSRKSQCAAAQKAPPF